MSEVLKWREPSKESPHRKFWEQIKAGGRVWREDPLNNVQEWLDLASLDGDANAIVKYGYKNLSILNPLAQLPETGCVLGMPYPDWPENLTTFAERKAYQLGVAHGKAVQKHEDAQRIAALSKAPQMSPIRNDLLPAQIIILDKDRAKNHPLTKGQPLKAFYLRVTEESGAVKIVDLDGALTPGEARKIAHEKGYNPSHWMEATDAHPWAYDPLPPEKPQAAIKSKDPGMGM